MAGLVPAIHVFLAVSSQEDMDARDKRGHDAGEVIRYRSNAVSGGKKVTEPLNHFLSRGDTR
jgi:hypothetical protein